MPETDETRPAAVRLLRGIGVGAAAYQELPGKALCLLGCLVAGAGAASASEVRQAHFMFDCTIVEYRDTLETRRCGAGMTHLSAGSKFAPSSADRVAFREFQGCMKRVGEPLSEWFLVCASSKF